ncbi:MAG: hypothetical protein JKY65_33220 [Planctomycetes bacterium]|nr:hypothetical protein [Planctomycetota bacterium]
MNSAKTSHAIWCRGPVQGALDVCTHCNRATFAEARTKDEFNKLFGKEEAGGLNRLRALHTQRCISWAVAACAVPILCLGTGNGVALTLVGAFLLSVPLGLVAGYQWEQGQKLGAVGRRRGRAPVVAPPAQEKETPEPEDDVLACWACDGELHEGDDSCPTCGQAVARHPPRRKGEGARKERAPRVAPEGAAGLLHKGKETFMGLSFVGRAAVLWGTCLLLLMSCGLILPDRSKSRRAPRGQEWVDDYDQLEIPSPKPKSSRKRKASPAKRDPFGVPSGFRPDYSWAGGDRDLSYGAAQRFEARIVLPRHLSESEVEANLRHALRELDRKRTADALSVLAYRKGDDTRGAFTAGQAVFAPGGEWAAAERGTPRSRFRVAVTLP